MSASEKEKLRRELLWRRARLEGREEKDRAVFRALTASPLYQKAGEILFYVSAPQEVDTRRLLAAALQEGKEAYAPFCPAGRGDMRFYRVREIDGLRPGRFGILEPDPARCEEWNPEKDVRDALCLVPGVAFDARGFRLGYGKGYYDRFLAGKTITTVGLCYQELVFRRLPAEKHDRNVELLATEEGVVPCR